MSVLTFNQAVEAVKETRAAFDASDMRSIVNHNMALLRKMEAQILEDGGECNFHIPAYRWNIEQAIINRNGEGTMASAAYKYTESMQEQMLNESGLV